MLKIIILDDNKYSERDICEADIVLDRFHRVMKDRGQTARRLDGDIYFAYLVLERAFLSLPIDD